MGTDSEYTPAQRLFAGEHAGELGSHAGYDGMLAFVYAEQEHGTVRWLIDAAGEVVEHSTFRRREPPLMTAERMWFGAFDPATA